MGNKTPAVLTMLAIVGAIIVLLAILLDHGGGDGGEQTVRPTPTIGAPQRLPAFGPHPMSPPGEGPQPLAASRVMFCVPATLLGETRVIGLVPEGTQPQYRGGTCDPLLGAGETVVVVDRRSEPRTVAFERASVIDDIERVVWLPAPAPNSLVLTGRFIASAQVAENEFGERVVIVEFDPEGQELLRAITRGTIGLPMTIFIDGKQLRTSDGELWTLPIREEIAGPIVFQGLEQEVALALSDQLNALLDDE